MDIIRITFPSGVSVRANLLRDQEPVAVDHAHDDRRVESRVDYVPAAAALKGSFRGMAAICSAAPPAAFANRSAPGIPTPDAESIAAK